MDGILIFYIGIEYIQGTFFDNLGTEKITIKKPIKLYCDEEIIEQNPEEWFNTVVEIIKEIGSSNPNLNINSISVTYEPGTLIFVDRCGNHLMNAILPWDKRAKYQSRMCEKIVRKHNDTIYIPWGYMTLPKILYIKYNKPDIYRKVFKILTPDGYIAYRLCGETAVDNYSAAFLGYNLKTCVYNSKLLANLGIDIKLLPEVCKPGKRIGMISGEMKDDLGLKSDVQFLISSNSFMSLSTFSYNSEEITLFFDADSSRICFICNTFKTKKDSEMIRLPYNNAYIYGYMGNYEARFLKWLNDITDKPIIKITNYSPGSRGLMIIPCIMGDSLYNNFDLKSSIIGINNNNIEDLITANYEAIGYIFKEKLDKIIANVALIDSIEVLSSINDEIFYHILSDITTKNIKISNKCFNCVNGIYNLIYNIKNEDNHDKKLIESNEERNYIYKQFTNLYKSAYTALNNVYRYRTRIMKKLI